MSVPAEFGEVGSLVKKIHGRTWHRCCLSETKNSRWIVTKVTVVRDDLILVDLSDGNRAESVLFDQDYQQELEHHSQVSGWRLEAQERTER